MSVKADQAQTRTPRHRRERSSSPPVAHVLTGLTFAIAGVHLALAIATVAQGEFSALSIAGVVPALAAVFLGVHALRRRSLPLCTAVLPLLVWSALVALV